jgi:hypothetical protein
MARNGAQSGKRELLSIVLALGGELRARQKSTDERNGEKEPRKSLHGYLAAHDRCLQPQYPWINAT